MERTDLMAAVKLTLLEAASLLVPVQTAPDRPSSDDETGPLRLRIILHLQSEVSVVMLSDTR